MAWNKAKQSLFTLGESSISRSREHGDDADYGSDSDDDGAPWPKKAIHAKTAFGTRWHEENPSCVV